MDIQIIKKYFLILVLVFIVPSLANAEKIKQQAQLPGMRGTPSNLPDISVIGECYGQTSDDSSTEDQNKLLLKSVELALQGYIYPKLRADVIFAMHKHEGNLEWELEEAKFTASQVIGGLGLRGGKALVDVGKINGMHPHHWPYFIQPAVLGNFFGDHGLMAEGIQVSYLLPLPVFLQLSAGTWEAASHSHEHDEGEEDSHSQEFSLASHVATYRAWSSYPLAGNSELELGLNYVEGSGVHHEEHKDCVKLYGADLTLKLWPAAHKRFILQSEYYQLNREVPVGELKRAGYYAYLGYRLNKYWEIGSRYDNSDNAMPDNEITESVSAIITHSLNETSYLRGEYQYSVQPESANTFYLQFVFGMGPHSHPLQ